MKRLLVFLFAFSFFIAHAQNTASWKITIHQKTIFAGTEENEQKNIVTINRSRLSAGGDFIFAYTDNNKSVKKNEWKRVIGVYNLQDDELVRKDGSSLRLRSSLVKKWLVKNQTLRLYTWALPKDPKEAARVRIRRVHLCTIVLK